MRARATSVLMIVVLGLTTNATAGTEAGLNTFYGHLAGSSNTSGTNNAFVGAFAGTNNEVGSNNTYVGDQAGFLASQASNNTYIGSQAGHDSYYGNNTFVGAGAGKNSAGGLNVFVGDGAGFNNQADGNTFIGSTAGWSNTSGSANTFIGHEAGNGNTSGSYDTFIGKDAGYSNTTGSGNAFLGISAGFNNTTGDDNTFLGTEAGLSNTTGIGNTIVGRSAGFLNSTGSGNTLVGREAGANTTGWRNTLIGEYAGRNNNGWNNVFIGWSAGANEPHSYRLCIDGFDRPDPLIYGQFDLRFLRINGDVHFPGIPGGNPQSQLHFSPGNTDTGGWITSVADNNFWLSSGAMYMNSLGWIQKSPDGLAVMAGSGPAGYRIMTRSGCEVDTVCPPTTRLTVDYSGNVGLGITPAHPLHLAGGAYSNGASWINGSSREYKDNIRDLTTEEALSAFQGLNPVAFTYKTAGGEQHIGFIAEDVPELVATKDRKGLSPMDIVAVLTKVVQEQQGLIKALQGKNEKLEQRLLVLEGKER